MRIKIVFLMLLCAVTIGNALARHEGESSSTYYTTQGKCMDSRRHGEVSSTCEEYGVNSGAVYVPGPPKTKHEAAGPSLGPPDWYCRERPDACH